MPHQMTSDPTKEVSISRPIYASKKLGIDLFLYVPSGEYSISKTGSIGMRLKINPLLMLRLNNVYGKGTSNQTANFRISPRNIYRIVLFFDTVLHWFTDPNMKDLFMLTDDNLLVFNNDYNSLSLLTEKDQFESGMLKAVPAIIDYGESRYEGISLFINTTENIVQLTVTEVKNIYGILKSFSFAEEVNLSIMTLDYLDRRDLITKYDPATKYNYGADPWKK